jgi:hypothetical protein
MLKQIIKFCIGAVLGYGGIRFVILAHTLLASGQFFTPILSTCFASVLIVAAVCFIMDSLV